MLQVALALALLQGTPDKELLAMCVQEAPVHPLSVGDIATLPADHYANVVHILHGRWRGLNGDALASSQVERRKPRHAVDPVALQHLRLGIDVGGSGIEALDHDTVRSP